MEKNDRDSFVDGLYSEYRSDAKGEGSRGGKIVGHTKSGKPVYMGYRHGSHHEGKNKLTSEEHGEAARIHNTIANDLPEGGSMENIEKRQNHRSSAQMHTVAKRTGYGG